MSIKKLICKKLCQSEVDYKTKHTELITKLDALTDIRDLNKKFRQEAGELKSRVLGILEENEITIYTKKVNSLIDRVFQERGYFRTPEELKEKYERNLYKAGFTSHADYEKQLRNRGDFSLSVLGKALDEGVTYGDDVWEEYLLSLNDRKIKKAFDVENRQDIIRDDILKKFGEIILENPAKFKEKFNTLNIFKLIVSSGKNINVLQTIFSDKEMARIIEEVELTEEQLASLEELPQETKEKIVWEMPAALYGSSFKNKNSYINLFAKWLPKDQRVEYFSENIGGGNSYCYGFMDEDYGVFSLIGTDYEVLSLEQLKEVMKNYEPYKGEVYIDEMFEAYEKQLAIFERRKERKSEKE